MTIRSEPQPAGEDLFAEWLARHLEGAAPEFSRFCADHPLEADELRSAYERWRGLEGVFARAG